jgi:hypothetical protein
MPPFGPISRRDFVRAMRRAGFDGPFRGNRHDILERGPVSVRIPNEHGADISTNLLHRLLRQAGISRDEWERLSPAAVQWQPC